MSSDQSGALYQWLDCNTGMSPIGGETAQSFNPAASGIYAVEVSLGSCVDTSSCYVMMITGIAEQQNAEVSIYPNPATERLTIDNRSGQALEFEILDVVGNNVYSGKLITGKSAIDISQFADGLYFLKAGKNGRAVKIVKN
jgi:hypothetical protein